MFQVHEEQDFRTGEEMIEIGRLCVKIAGRDAGKKCLIVDIIDDNHVLIDGETRRRKCNIGHLELLDEVAKIKKGASHDEIIKEFKKKGWEVKTTKPKPKTEKPKKVRKGKTKEEKEKIKAEKKAKKEKSKTKEKPKKDKVKKKGGKTEEKKEEKKEIKEGKKEVKEEEK